MTKAEFITWATSRGWTQDKWGHLQSKDGGYRFKLSSIAVRYERKTSAGWIRLASNFFSRLEISGTLMPACFQLTRKGSSEPSTFHAIDEEIYSIVGEPVHEKYWCRGWYDSIGFMLATGKTFDEIRTWCKEWAPTLIEVVDFLEANYDVNAWYERGRR